MGSASPVSPSAENGQDQADTQETYHRAREGLVNYMHGRGRHDFAWEMIPEMDGGCGRVVAMWEVIGAMERHFGDHQAHMHTKQSRQ